MTLTGVYVCACNESSRDSPTFPEIIGSQIKWNSANSKSVLGVRERALGTSMQTNQRIIDGSLSSRLVPQVHDGRAGSGDAGARRAA